MGGHRKGEGQVDALQTEEAVFRNPATVLNQPKISSIRLRRRRLAA